jgi:hypothetical protein
VAQWPKPSEDSWTEHDTPEFYELERDAIFKRAVEIWHQPRPVDSADAYLDRVVEPLP